MTLLHALAASLPLMMLCMCLIDPHMTIAAWQRRDGTIVTLDQAADTH